MTISKLQKALGEEGYAEFLALMAEQTPAPPTKWNALLNGMLKSWTIWGGAILLGFPLWWPEVEPIIRKMIDPGHYERLMLIPGIVMILLRFKTTQSLEKKGRQAITP